MTGVLPFALILMGMAALDVGSTRVRRGQSQDGVMWLVAAGAMLCGGLAWIVLG
jgi:hypothetical protein